MYQYKISSRFKHKVKDNVITSVLVPEYTNVNSRGFADLLSCSLETTNQVRCAKDKIERINEPVWEEVKKATNPYELIYATPTVAVANLKPLSRSFFKMIEMINEFASGLMNSNILISLHIAEGPGGFIEATRFIRQLRGFKNDTAFGITLINKIDCLENTKNLPAWKQSNYFLRTHPEVIISYGVDGTGNIYNPNNITHLYTEINNHCSNNYNHSSLSIRVSATVNVGGLNKIKKKEHKPQYRNNMFSSLEADLEAEPESELAACKDKDGSLERDGEVKRDGALEKDGEVKRDGSLEMDGGCESEIDRDIQYGNASFITADGGFDYSIDYNYQEQASSKLIFSQIITALKCQTMDGIFICKIFDMNLLITVEMIYLLNLLYKEVIIYKPFTSRVANSEKYLICTGFNGINKCLLDKLLSILVDWNKANLSGQTFNRLFTEIPDYFIEEIKRINNIIVSKQIDIINKIMHIYQHKLNLNSEWKKENYKKQYAHAIEWCQKYNIPYN